MGDAVIRYDVQTRGPGRAAEWRVVEAGVDRERAEYEAFTRAAKARGTYWRSVPAGTSPDDECEACEGTGSTEDHYTCQQCVLGVNAYRFRPQTGGQSWI